jgi:hypothetical protein
MKSKDIDALNNLFNKVLIKESTGGEASGPADAPELIGIKAYSEPKYDKEGQNLRSNFFTTDDDKPIVLFYTMQRGGDENDVLHNAAGPAVVFEGGGEGKEFYFIEGEQVSPDSDEYKTANAEFEYQDRASRLGKKKTDTLSSGGSDLDIFD